MCAAASQADEIRLKADVEESALKNDGYRWSVSPSINVYKVAALFYKSLLLLIRRCIKVYSLKKQDLGKSI